MIYPGSFTLMWLCLLATLLPHDATGSEPEVDPELRAQLEAKVMSSMSLRDIETMVENDERVVNAPKSRIIIIPRKDQRAGLLGEDQREALVIHRKPNRRTEHKTDYGYHPQRRYEPDHAQFQPGYGPHHDPFRRRYDEPAYGFDFGPRSEDFPSSFGLFDLESAHSTPVRQFYESIVDSVMKKREFGEDRDPFALLEMAASEAEPSYEPRFDYRSYAKDSTATKLEGKPYWKDAPERRDETVDENGCRTVVKRVVDPEGEKSDKPKSVVITKECEYPTLNGPDAKIAEATPFRHHRTSRFDDSPASDGDTYEKTRPKELDTEARDPIKPDYIDSMLEKHFKSFHNPLSPFRGFQDRFKLRVPEAFKSVKPKVDVKTYEYSSDPESGFDDEDSDRDGSYRQSDEYQPRGGKRDYSGVEPQEKSSDDDTKEPKMLKKSFAYYRKDNPKSKPDDHQYAEEYAHGNYRSFSSSYDSEKDGQKKKQ